MLPRNEGHTFSISNVRIEVRNLPSTFSELTVGLFEETRHCKVGGYILIFHFLRLIRGTLSSDRDIRRTVSSHVARWRMTTESSWPARALNRVPRGSDYTNRWFIIDDSSFLPERNHRPGRWPWKRWKKKLEETVEVFALFLTGVWILLSEVALCLTNNLNFCGVGVKKLFFC